MSLVQLWTELGDTPILEAIRLYGIPARRSSLASCCSASLVIRTHVPTTIGRQPALESEPEHGPVVYRFSTVPFQGTRASSTLVGAISSDLSRPRPPRPP